ncbi:serine acetyltransferase [Lactiplantibacillus dongliensis]|uniref:Serine acetyltransferase n=1 Tax=Lactiplantibacillus dongliensis TaxID=2559919 RepID=A0ABW1R1E7_9LACO|nr:DapH/DapD/GlmU-related protein [Lactiplantibacillus dongliensis]
MNEYIKSDLFRCYGNSKLSTFIFAYIFNGTFRFQCSIRWGHTSGLKGLLGKILWHLDYTHNIVRIHYSTNIGFGLYIGHGGPIVVNSRTVIGNNVNLSQFTTIGSNSETPAKIGNNVYIGPNVCIVEHVTIEDNVTIGAGSVVTKDIPKNATAVGNYACVINFQDPGHFVDYRWVSG